MTVVARNEDEIEVNSIISRLEKISVKTHNLKERAITEHVSPVGTNYKRIQPQKEISSAQRESFWTKIREEEKDQKEQDNLKQKQEQKKIEVERVAIEDEKSALNQKKSQSNLLKEPIIKPEKTLPPSNSEPVKVKTGSSLVQRRIQSFTKALEDNKPPAIPDSPQKIVLNAKEKAKQTETESNMNAENLTLNRDSSTANKIESSAANLAQKASSLKISNTSLVVSSNSNHSVHDNLSIEGRVEQSTPSPENDENDLKPQASAEGEQSDDEQNVEELEEEEYVVNQGYQSNIHGHIVSMSGEPPGPNFFAVKVSILSKISF